MTNQTIIRVAVVAFATLLCLSAIGQERKLNIIAFGAHPDDCDGRAAGVATKWTALGHRVRFVAVTNGDAGHQSEGGGALGRRRRAESQESGRRLGVEYIVLDNHDGELLPTIHVREQIIRQMRQWNADLVLGPRPNDYHPDHRYTGVVLQDAAYMCTVPNICPDSPPLRKNPVFMYFQDNFQKPNPFTPDVAVAIDDVIEKKVSALDSHVSQYYEWMPWLDGFLDKVPKDASSRRAWLKTQWMQEVNPTVKQALVKWYGPEMAKNVKYAEAFEICEYGTRPSQTDLRRFFPFFPDSPK